LNDNAEYTTDDLDSLKVALYRNLLEAQIGMTIYAFRDKRELIYVIGLIHLYLENIEKKQGA
jgi:hypothetical protein